MTILKIFRYWQLTVNSQLNVFGVRNYLLYDEYVDLTHFYFAPFGLMFYLVEYLILCWVQPA